MNTNNVGAKILSEHQHLRALLKALEQHLQQPGESDVWLTGLRDMLAGLVDVCSEHFKLEEEAELHVQLREQSPRLASRLEKLLAEHARILAELQKLVADLATPSAAPGQTERLKQQVSSALEEVRQHERAENEVMMDAYWDDLGGEAG